MDTKEPFETQVTRHGPVVWRVCRAVLSTSADAEDAWSETFLAALRAYPDLPATANVQAWLVTIAHRKAVDVVRARSRAAVPVASLPEPPAHRDAPHEHDSPLWAAVAALPPKQRHAVAYRYLGGLPYRQIAELLGGTPEAARRAASDGVAALRKALITTAPANGTGTRAGNHAKALPGNRAGNRTGHHTQLDRTGEDR
ncbi:RNA polymerase subunit sigma [Kocuria rosea]|uniref:RNA polymerase sigma factor n=1 Tax=Kocuria rosea TaxID=1275 RepID=UPI000D65B2C6|nr:sigma-70 family RNA polymerase sigma factor [Kocuria rosea]PWF85154.1 RNA polymerase subunit sigma [Kocuria rosea]QCY31545.1 sigma-70 family RNA polymerase sigma factor [Kocuria rosea]TQN38928.1 RNA polymerase sigma factor (sigma-70 family) [Kocuria rosea]VEH41358.1 RNA polymerase sigma factor sigV [Kocuria rosea]